MDQGLDCTMYHGLPAGVVVGILAIIHKFDSSSCRLGKHTRRSRFPIFGELIQLLETKKKINKEELNHRVRCIIKLSFSAS